MEISLRDERGQCVCRSGRGILKGRRVDDPKHADHGMSIEAKCTLREERKGQFCMERSEERKPDITTRSCGLTCGFKDCAEMLTAAIVLKKQCWWSSLRWCFVTSFRFQWSAGNWWNKTQQYTNALSEGLVKVPKHSSGIRAKALQTTTIYCIFTIGFRKFTEFTEGGEVWRRE